MEKKLNRSGFPRILKIFLVKMKLTLTLMLFCLVSFGASTYSQNTRFSIMYNGNDIIGLFKQIEEKSEFYFFYQKEDLKDVNTVSVDVKDATVMEILDKVLSGSSLDYKIVDRYIIVRKSGSDIGRGEGERQQPFVNGKVIDSNGSPLPGVSVVVKGTSTGTVTDAQGKYTLTGIPQNATLLFSFVGMRKQEVTVGGKTTINITLIEEEIGIEEVVAIGYGKQKKINLTGALDVVSESDMKKISDRAGTTVSKLLQGVSPNLVFSEHTFSGEPGGKMAVELRGLGSLSGDDSPYILVDGVPMDLNSLNPNDIATITVLKDASSSAIYGARAPYGVILIETKRGKSQKMKIQLSNITSFSAPRGLPHLVNSLEYVTAHNQACTNAGRAPDFTENNIQRIKQYLAGEIKDETWLKPDGSDWYGNDIWSISGNANNDWPYLYHKDFALIQKYMVNVSGTDGKSSYYISGGYLDQPDELKYGDQYYKRYNLNANLETKPTDWLTFSLNTKYIDEARQFMNSWHGYNRNYIYRTMLMNSPARPFRLPNGEYSNISGVPMTQGGKVNYFDAQFITTLRAEIEPVKDWKTSISYNYKSFVSREINNKQTVKLHKPNGSEYVSAFPVSSYSAAFFKDDYNMFNVVSSYNKSIKDHNFFITVGYELEQDKYNYLGGKKNDVIAPQAPSISTSTGEDYIYDSKTHWATEGFFGRIQYNFKEKYLFEVNGRYDGSSKFEKGNRWAFFPSFSAGYNVDKEVFWSSIAPYVNTLKLRGSWGSLGNHNVANYLYLPIMGIGTNLYWIMGNKRPNYTTAPGIISDDLTWETSTTFDIGFDASFLKNRLSTSLDIFNRTTKNMFGPSEALPLLLGTSVPQKNNAELETKGFEWEVGWKDNVGNLFYYIKATLADNITKVVKYNNPTKSLSTWYEGQTIGEIWGLTTAGIYQTDAEAQNGPDQTLFYPRWQAGDIHYKDLDGDKKITYGTNTVDDPGDYSIIGNRRPRYQVGLNFGLGWKGFDFNMFWQGILKQDYPFKSNDMRFYGFSGQEWWNMNVFRKGDATTLDYWRPANETNMLGPNTDSFYPRPYLSNEDLKNKEFQTRYTLSCAFMRLKNLSIGYTIPNSITEKIMINHARVYLSGEDILVFTPMTKLIDPEQLHSRGDSGDISRYDQTDLDGHHVGQTHFPRSIYSVGIEITF
jgi:TonB-linked SusC/RagA family outer membrane protein